MTARDEAIGILGGGAVRQLEARGLVVAWAHRVPVAQPRAGLRFSCVMDDPPGALWVGEWRAWKGWPRAGGEVEAWCTSEGCAWTWDERAWGEEQRSGRLVVHEEPGT